MASVAKRYRVSAAQVAQWNGVATSARFKAGQTLVVYVAVKGRKSTQLAHAAGPAKAASHKAPARKVVVKPKGKLRVARN